MMEIRIEKYTYRLEWSEEDGCHIARCLEFPSLSAHGDTIEKALAEIQFVVRETISWLHEDGEAVPEPFWQKKESGRPTSDPEGNLIYA